jgi:hypothetical protein
MLTARSRRFYPPLAPAIACDKPANMPITTAALVALIGHHLVEYIQS